MLRTVLFVTLTALILTLPAGASAAPANATGGKPKDPWHGKKLNVCHTGTTLLVSVHAIPAHVRHGDRIGRCNPPSGGHHGTPVTPPVVPTGGDRETRVLLCMPYLVKRTDGTMGYAADVPISLTDEAPWLDGQLARNYQGIGATCDKLGGVQLTPGYFDRGTGYEYPVWRR